MAATFGYVNVIKRSGKDGSRFPLTEDCLIGSGLHCDIRIHLDDVATEHCLIKCQEEGKCLIVNLDKRMTTKLNDNDVTEDTMLRHGDIISVSDRLFRYEGPQISSVVKPTVTLLSHNMKDDTGSAKRLVAVVSPQIRERHETSQSLRTWLLRRSIGNTLSSRNRQSTRTAEDRRSTSLVNIYAQDSNSPAVPVTKTPHSVNLSRRSSVTSSVKKSLLKVRPHLRKSGRVSTSETTGSETPLTMKSAVSGSVPETPISKTPRSATSRVSYNETPASRKSKPTPMENSVASLTTTPNTEESEVFSSRRSYRKDTVEVSSSDKATIATPDVKFLGEQTTQFPEVQIVEDSPRSAVSDNTTPQSLNISRRTSVNSTGKKSIMKVTTHLRKSGRVSTVENVGSETPHSMKTAVLSNVPDLVDTPVLKTPRLKKSRVSYSLTSQSRKSNTIQMGKRSHSVESLKTTPNTGESLPITSAKRSSRKDSLGVSSGVKSTNVTPDVKFLGEQTTQFPEVQIVEDSPQSAVSDNTTPQSLNLSRRTSVKSTGKKSILKVTTHLRKSGRVSTVENVGSETPHSMKTAVLSNVPDLVDTPVLKTPRLKKSRVSYSLTPQSRKSNIIQMGKRSHSVESLKTTPNTGESLPITSAKRSSRKDSLGVSSGVKSTNVTPDVKFLGEQTTQFPEVQIVEDSPQSAVLDNTTPQSLNLSRRTSVKSTGKKSILKVTTHLRKSGRVSTVENVGSETPHSMKTAVLSNVPDLVDTPVLKTPRLKKSRVSYSLTPQSRKSNIIQMGKRSHSVESLKTTPNTEESVPITSTKRSSRKDSLLSSGVKSTNATPDVKIFGEHTTGQSPDLFSSDQLSVNKEMAPLKELQKSPALTERPKRKSAGLLLAHIRESQQEFSRSRRNSTPSANTNKTNTRSARASLVMPKKSRVSFTPISRSKTPRKLQSLRAMSAKAAKRRLTDVDLSEIAANKLKAESPKTPDKKKMAALLQCHKPRMLFSEVVKKTPVKKNIVAKVPSVPVIRRRKVPRKPKVHTPRKPPVKGINSTGHIDSPETIIIHGKQSMALKRPTQKTKEESETLKIKPTGSNLEQAKGTGTSVSVQESSREMNTRKSVSFSPAPQVVAFAASTRIITRKSLKIDNISEEIQGTPSPNNKLSLEKQPNRKTSILKKPSLSETHAELIESNSNSPAIKNVESVNSRSSVVSSTPVRVSERHKGRTSSQSPSTPKIGRSSRGVAITHQSPGILNTSIGSQASSTFDFDAVTTPCISVEKLVSPLNTTSSKKQTNTNLSRLDENISAQQIFKDLVADKVIDSKWSEADVNAATDANHSAGSEALAMSSGKKSNRRSVSFPVKRHSIRKSQGRRSSGKVYASTNKTVPELNLHEMAPVLQKNRDPARLSKDLKEHAQISGTTVEDSAKFEGSSASIDRKSQQSATVDVNCIEDTNNDKRSMDFLSDNDSLSNGYVKQQSISRRQRKSVINDLTHVRGVKRLFDGTNKQGSPLNDLTDVRGVKQLLKSPKQQKSPRNDLTDIRGVKQLLKTPRTQKSPQNDLTDVRGVKRLLRSPSRRFSPKNDLTDVRGVKRLLRSPFQQKSPQNDLTDVRGVKMLFRSTGKQASPKNDLTDVRGVKQLLEPRQPQKSPINDLTDVRGVKQILKSPQQQKSPGNDLTDVRGVKELFRSTRKRAFPENDLSDLRGVKRLLRSPLQPKSPRNDLSDVVGVSSLFNSPQQEANKKLAVNQELSLKLKETKDSVETAKQETANATVEQEATISLGAKRRKHNPKERETKNTSSEELVSLNSYSTRGRRAKKEFTNPDIADVHSNQKSKPVKDHLSQKTTVPSDVEPESHKNTDPPRTRRGKVKVTGVDTTVPDVEKRIADTTNNLEQRDVILSNTGHNSPSITNSPRARRTRKQVVTEQSITINLAASPDNTSSPRTLRRKKITVPVPKASEEIKSRSAVQTDSSIKVLETEELLAHPTQLLSLDTAASTRTRRGRKQIVTNQKVKGEVLQLPDELEKPEQDGLTKTSELGSNTVSPLKTRRGKKLIEKNKEQDEGLKSPRSKLQPEVEAKQQRSKAITLLTNENVSESKESDTVLLKPQQKRVNFADEIQVSSPSNSSSPRTRRGKKQVVSNDERDEHDLKANNQLLSDEKDKPLGTRRQRKEVHEASVAANVECSPSSITDQTRTRRGRKMHTTDVSKELKLPLKAQSLPIDRTGETTATGESKQNKVSNDSDGVVFMNPSTVSPPKARRGRKAVALTESSTVDVKEKTGVNKAREDNVATAVALTLDKGNDTPDVPVLTPSKRTLRGKKENVAQVTATNGMLSVTNEIEESKGVKSKRSGRKQAINLGSDNSAVSIDKGTSKETVIDNSPPKMKPDRIQTETESTSDSIENRLLGLTRRTRQTAASTVSKIIDHPNEASEEKISNKRRGVRQPKKETNKNEEPEQEQSSRETVQRSTRSKRKQVQEEGEESPKKKKKTQSDRLLETSPEPKVVSPRTTRQRKNRRT